MHKRPVNKPLTKYHPHRKEIPLLTLSPQPAATAATKPRKRRHFREPHASGARLAAMPTPDLGRIAAAPIAQLLQARLLRSRWFYSAYVPRPRPWVTRQQPLRGWHHRQKAHTLTLNPITCGFSRTNLPRQRQQTPPGLRPTSPICSAGYANRGGHSETPNQQQSHKPHNLITCGFSRNNLPRRRNKPLRVFDPPPLFAPQATQTEEDTLNPHNQQQSHKPHNPQPLNPLPAEKQQPP